MTEIRSRLPEPLPAGAGSEPGTATPVTIYDSADPRPRALIELHELARCRALLWTMVSNQIKARYRRSTLGLAWALINPLLNTAVLSIAFSSLFHADVPNYPAYVMTGLLVWNYFVQSTVGGIEGAAASGGLASRVYVPRSVVVLSAAGDSLVAFLLGLLPLALIMLLGGHSFHATWLLLPFAVVILIAFALGLALLVATLAVFFGDVAHFYRVLVQVFFFVTPIVYPRDIVPARWQALLALNPMYSMVAIFRALLVEGHLPDWSLTLTAAGLAGGMLALGWWVYSEKAHRFAYYV